MSQSEISFLAAQSSHDARTSSMAESEKEILAANLRNDLMTLTKVRLNVFVLITTFFGYWLGAKSHDSWSIFTLLHTLLGTALAAFGSAVFNQLMEIDLDARMKRTANRPLPARRMEALPAFLLGAGLSAWGIVHLWHKVNVLSAGLAALTLVTYIFLYTPMKRYSSANTLAGAIPGAIPPMIGWAAAGGSMDASAWFLFALLFFWQLPHFVAINWMHRAEYENAGYKMWSNGDLTGNKSAKLCVMWSLCLTACAFLPWLNHRASLPWLIIGIALGLYMTFLSWKFLQAASHGKTAERTDARKLFFFTLIYLPIALAACVIFWK